MWSCYKLEKGNSHAPSEEKDGEVDDVYEDPGDEMNHDSKRTVNSHEVHKLDNRGEKQKSVKYNPLYWLFWINTFPL